MLQHAQKFYIWHYLSSVCVQYILVCISMFFNFQPAFYFHAVHVWWCFQVVIGHSSNALSLFFVAVIVEMYSHFFDDLHDIGSVLCVGSEWHRYPSSFLVPEYVREVRWIDDGFRGLLPLPFNSTLGGTSAAPSYFNNKNQASDQQYVIHPTYLLVDKSFFTVIKSEKINFVR